MSLRLLWKPSTSRAQEALERVLQMKRLCYSTLLETSEASFSDDMRHRYTLWRCWEAGPRVNFLLLNPSKADHFANDPTVERCQRRAVKWGFGTIIITNLFAYRATDPQDMLQADDPVGPDNDDAIIESASQSEIVVCGWGAHGKHLGRGEAVLAMLTKWCERKLRYLRLNQDGTPGHPLYLPYRLQPVPWVRSAGT